MGKWKKGRLLTDLVVDRYVNLDLFYRKQTADSTTGCKIWTGVTNNIGYGFIGFRRIDPVTGEPAKGDAGMMTTHRLAWMITHKRLPDQPNINHTCHNKLCCEPTHLVQGTQQEKITAMRKDNVLTGRAPGVATGGYLHKQHGRQYRYSDSDIQWVRSAKTADIAARYNISRSRACAMQQGFRTGYVWLPWPEGLVVRKRKKKNQDQ